MHTTPAVTHQAVLEFRVQAENSVLSSKASVFIAISYIVVQWYPSPRSCSACMVLPSLLARLQFSLHKSLAGPHAWAPQLLSQLEVTRHGPTVAVCAVQLPATSSTAAGTAPGDV